MISINYLFCICVSRLGVPYNSKLHVGLVIAKNKEKVFPSQGSCHSVGAGNGFTCMCWCHITCAFNLGKFSKRKQGERMRGERNLNIRSDFTILLRVSVPKVSVREEGLLCCSSSVILSSFMSLTAWNCDCNV